jgi:hypothetical protein
MNDFDDDEEEDEENVAVAKLQFWHINVHVHGKTINISCGDATQRLKWLAHVAIGECGCLPRYFAATTKQLTSPHSFSQRDGTPRTAKAGRDSGCRHPSARSEKMETK